jgi:hypothetical protein
MHVTRQKGDANHSLLREQLKSSNEPIALLLGRYHESRTFVKVENKDLVKFGRPMIILKVKISSERKERKSMTN